MDMVSRIEVGGARPYPVLIGGQDLYGELPALVGRARQVAVVSAPPLAARARRVAQCLRDAGRSVVDITIPDAEAGKSLEVAARCWAELGRANVTRTDAIVGVGGGAVTDLAGFVAACWLRGVDWVAVPTSLLGMVDAAVGGKTGINTESGKNLVGAFHSPVAVLCDLSNLETLPAIDVASGLAEVVKCGFIADPGILELIEADRDAVRETSSPVLRELIERAISVKASVVSKDFRESGLRETLNYGHTLAHAIEKIEGYTWRHGFAVSVGLVYAAELAHRARGLDSSIVDRHRQVLELLGLPVRYRPEAWPDLLAAMRIDKKARAATLRFVVLDRLGHASTVDDIDDDVLAEVYQEVCA